MRSTPAAPPPLAWQGSLLAGGEPGPDPTFAGGRRIQLDETAWVDVVAGWLHGADALFDDLVSGVRWLAHEMPIYDKVLPQPRLSRWWGTDREPPWPPVAGAMAGCLSGGYGIEFDSLGANLYRDGRDSVAWHGDRSYREHQRALVAVVSLGSTRRFLLRPKGGGPSLRLDPAAGDLLVMGGTCQRTWQHCVPKRAAAGPRISVTLRHGQELLSPDPPLPTPRPRTTR